MFGLSEVGRRGEDQTVLKLGHLMELNSLNFLCRQTKYNQNGQYKFDDSFSNLQNEFKIKLKIFHAYAPRTNHLEEQVEHFCDCQKNTINATSTHYSILTGHYNAK